MRQDICKIQLQKGSAKKQFFPKPSSIKPTAIPTMKGLFCLHLDRCRLQSTTMPTVKGLKPKKKHHYLFWNRALQSTVKKNSNCERFSSGQEKTCFSNKKSCSPQSRKIRTVKGLARVKKNLVFRTESCSPQSRKIPTVKGLARVNFF